MALQWRSWRSCSQGPRYVTPIVFAVLMLVAVSVAPASAAPPTTPEVTGVSPNYGPAVGGTALTIDGVNFAGSTAVEFVSDFGREVDAESFSVNSDAEISAVSPAGIGIVDVTVTGPGGTSAVNPQDRFGYGQLIDQMTPQHGPAAGGTEVTLSGFGLEQASAVDFGSSSATSFTVNEDGSITATSPPATPGSTVVEVIVTTPEGPSATYTIPDTEPANYFSYGPTVTRVTPHEDSVLGGASVTIVGTGFKSPVYRCLCGPFVYAVYFGSAKLDCGLPPGAEVPCTPVDFKVVSDSEITAVAPPGTGTVDVQVETAGGISPVSPADRFNYYQFTCAFSMSSNGCSGGRGNLPSSCRESQSAAIRQCSKACFARARVAFRTARKSAKHLHGRARARAMKRAVRLKRRAFSECRSRSAA